DGGTFPPLCTKELRIYNNTSGPIYPVIQGSIQLTNAISDTIDCTKKADDPNSGGDVWLQRALGSTAKCFPDWWRAGRIMFFDDKTAQTEIYNKTKAIPVTFDSGSPKPACRNSPNCTKLDIFRVPSGSGIDAHLPIQLNEYTFADIAPLGPPDNGRFV